MARRTRFSIQRQSGFGVMAAVCFFCSIADCHAGFLFLQRGHFHCDLGRLFLALV